MLYEVTGKPEKEQHCMPLEFQSKALLSLANSHPPFEKQLLGCSWAWAETAHLTAEHLGTVLSELFKQKPACTAALHYEMEIVPIRLGFSRSRCNDNLQECWFRLLLYLFFTVSFSIHTCSLTGSFLLTFWWGRRRRGPGLWLDLLGLSLPDRGGKLLHDNSLGSVLKGVVK